MKITKEVKTFVPIIMTVETEEEADYLWHVLNCADDLKFKDYLYDNRFAINYSAADGVMRAFFNTYRPGNC